MVAEKFLTIENVVKEINGNVIINDMSFMVRAGEICAVIGKNGAGKSTLFKLLTGQITATKGGFSYIYSQKEINPSIGALIEKPSFFKNFSAFNNLKYFSIQKGKNNENEIKEILKTVGLSESKKTFARFSLGMKQRLGIALALLFKPEILILDEPVNGLDPEGIRDIREILRKINKNFGTTIIISSHILTELEEISDSYIFIDKGELIEKIAKKDFQKKMKHYTKIIVDDVYKATKVLEDNFPKLNYSVESEKQILITENSELLGVINERMVLNNISVLGIETQKSTLEDYYLKVISRREQYE